MYYLLLAMALDEVPQTSAARLCIELASERDSKKSITPIPFTIHQTNLQRDYLPIGNAPGKLCSQRLINMLGDAAVLFTAYPTHLIDKETEQEIPSRYFYWIPQWIEGTIDWERSEEWVIPETGTRHLTKLVLTEATILKAPMLFQTRERGFYLIHEKLRAQLEAVLIAGMAFASLDTVYLPQEGVKKALLERVLTEHPEDSNSWYELSNTYVLLHRYQEAHVVLDRAIACRPDFEEAWYRQGVILHTLGQLQNASKALRRAIELNPLSKAWIEYSAVLRDMGRYQEALEMAEQGVQIWNQTSLSWHELAASQAALKRYQEALGAIEQALRLGGGGGSYLADMYRIKGEMLTGLDRYEEALTSCEIGLSYAPTKRALWADKVNLLHRLERNEESIVAQRELDRLEQRREKNLQKRPE